ncbi:hypothetical protein [Halomonas sp. NO4]|uniref:hypothetical protein n=1 Tax=Halomonas sp. NO4 TaxID=2484813 RepID=UPI0013D03A9E|nr:hypothetical protein [Halomonas sp. NO4]
MQNFHEWILLDTAHGAVAVTVGEAVRLLGVHEKTAQRWARGTQRPSPERAALLAILSGQVVPWRGWAGWQVRTRHGPAPTRRPFTVLVAPDGRELRPDYPAPSE